LALRVEDDRGHAEREFLQHGDRHEGPVARRVAADEQEDELPRQRHADEAVEVLRVRDGRRVVAPDLRFQEELRGFPTPGLFRCRLTDQNGRIYP
jgi:hypothetical protein